MIVNKQNLSKIIGKSEKTLTVWQKEDPPLPIKKIAKKKGQSNEYETVDVIEWMISRKNKKLDYNEERTRLTSLQADHKDLEIKILKGSLLPVDVVKELWSGMIAAAKNKILGIRSDVKMKNPEIDIDILDVIQSVCKEALNELSTDKLPGGIVSSVGRYRKNLETAAKSKTK